MIKKEKNSSLSVLVRNIEALKKMPEGTTNTAYYCHFWEMEFWWKEKEDHYFWSKALEYNLTFNTIYIILWFLKNEEELNVKNTTQSRYDALFQSVPPQIC